MGKGVNGGGMLDDWAYGNSLLLLGEVNEGGYAGFDQAIQFGAGRSVVDVSGILSSREFSRDDPVAVFGGSGSHAAATSGYFENGWFNSELKGILRGHPFRVNNRSW